MSYAPRLLSALVALDGEALVLHPGDLPYIATPRGPVDLASRPLTMAALEALLDELLPPASRDELNLQGAMQWRAPLTPRFPDQQFTLVAARVDGELWVEVRRQAASAAPRTATPASAGPAAAVPVGPPPARAATTWTHQAEIDELIVPSAEDLWRGDDSF